MLPLLSTAMASGESSEALTAKPPSPERLKMPFPATTLRIPSGPTRMTMALSASQMNMLPALSVATSRLRRPPMGAWTAGRPSPGNSQSVPATVVIVFWPDTGERNMAASAKMHWEVLRVVMARLEKYFFAVLEFRFGPLDSLGDSGRRCRRGIRKKAWAEHFSFWSYSVRAIGASGLHHRPKWDAGGEPG